MIRPDTDTANKFAFLDKLNSEYFFSAADRRKGLSVQKWIQEDGISSDQRAEIFPQESPNAEKSFFLVSHN
jgi:hypothetical protein